MQKEQDREAIYRSIFFCDMDRKKADEIIDRLGGRTVTYDKGEIIIREREKLNNIGILLDGGLCKVQYYRDGTEQLVQKLVSSFVVGVEIAVSEKKTSPYDIYASEQAHIFWFPVRAMEEEGVLFMTNTNIGKDYRAAKLLKDYDCVILACGASNPRDIKVPGREADGIYFAVDFLKANTKSLLNSNLTDGKNISAKGKHVIVIGGGDTGNDCVGTSIRHGCASVTQLEMMPKLPEQRTPDNSWPEWPRVLKTDYGQEEAIAVFGSDPRIYQTTVKEFKKDKDGKVCAVVTVKLEPKKDEKTGRMNMVPVAGSEKELPADLVLIAAGFLGSQKYVTDAFGVEVNARTNVATAPDSYKTNVDKVFVTGDMHRGQSLVVWAVREGREVAKEVDFSLMGYTNLT